LTIPDTIQKNIDIVPSGKNIYPLVNGASNKILPFLVVNFIGKTHEAKLKNIPNQQYTILIYFDISNEYSQSNISLP
jgi:hypothetical protein